MLTNMFIPIGNADPLISLSNSILAMDFTVPELGESSILIVNDSQHYPGENIFSDGGLVRIVQEVVIRAPNASPEIRRASVWGIVEFSHRLSNAAAYWFTRDSVTTGFRSVTPGTVRDESNVIRAGGWAYEYPHPDGMGLWMCYQDG